MYCFVSILSTLNIKLGASNSVHLFHARARLLKVTFHNWLDRLGRSLPKNRVLVRLNCVLVATSEIYRLNFAYDGNLPASLWTETFRSKLKVELSRFS